MIETIDGNMRIEIKIFEMPKMFDSGRDRKKFYVNAGGAIVGIRIKPKQVNQFTQAQQDFEGRLWYARITGEMGKISKNSFELQNVGISFFERKE